MILKTYNENVWKRRLKVNIINYDLARILNNGVNTIFDNNPEGLKTLKKNGRITRFIAYIYMDYNTEMAWKKSKKGLSFKEKVDIKNKLDIVHIDDEIEEFFTIPYIEGCKVLEDRYYLLKDKLLKNHYNGSNTFLTYVRKCKYDKKLRSLN